MAMSEEAFDLPQWSLGDRLQKAREHAGLTRDELAERLGVKKNSLWNWEADASRPRDLLDLLNKWAKETNVPVQWLLGVSPTFQSEYATPSLHLLLGGQPEQLRLPALISH